MCEFFTPGGIAGWVFGPPLIVISVIRYLRRKEG